MFRDVKKDSILCSVGEETIVKLLRSLETPIHRGQTGDIFFTLLYGYQHSPTLFHKVGWFRLLQGDPENCGIGRRHLNNNILEVHLLLLDINTYLITSV